MVETETLRILIVDDEAALRRGMERVLREFAVSLPGGNGSGIRFEIDETGSAEEALETIGRQPPDILLLDYRLPGLTGLDLLERIAAVDPPILTVLISAYATLETAVAATKRGAFDVLAKPVRPNELTATIEKVARHIVYQRQARALAEERKRVRYQFVSILAHELKAPLAAVAGYLDILKDREAAIGSGMYDQIIERSMARIDGLKKLINDMLDLTRIESGQRKRKVEEIDLYDVASTCVEVAKVDAIEHDVSVSLTPDRGPIPLLADRSEMEIIFNNLLSNAVKYNREGGTIDVVIEPNGEQLTIRIADTGIGMTDEEANTVFNDFARAKNERTRNIPGSGLGLSILKRLVALYDGDVSVESEPNVGTEFTVHLKCNVAPELAP
jgi:signal transduction histidine kinase